MAHGMEPMTVPSESPARSVTPNPISIRIQDTESRPDIASAISFTPEIYAQRVYLHRRSSIATSLYAGGDFTTLAEFLRSPQLRNSKTAVTGPPAPFAYLYKLDFKSDLVPTRLEWSQKEEEIRFGTNCLLFLTGYPYAEWLNKLGCYYGIDPEFYHRHMSFLWPKTFSSAEVIAYSPSLVLPSSKSTIFELTYISVGMEENRSHKGLAQIQKESDTQMQRYFQDLRDGGQWEPEHSIVRSYCVHGNNTFSIEQKLTVYTAKQRMDTNLWIVVVWLDSGESLAESPPGPWSALDRGPHQHHFHPSCMYKPGIALKEHRVVNQAEDLNLNPLEQSARLLPRFYGRSLKKKEMSSDPFYALNEVFAFVVSSELSFLRTISSDLDAGLDEEEENQGQGCCNLTLMHYQQLLERQIHRIGETLHFVDNRHVLGWPKLDNPTPRAVKAEASLKLDLEYLLREGRRLHKRCKLKLEIRKSRNEGAVSTPSKEVNTDNYCSWRSYLVGGIATVLIVIVLIFKFVKLVKYY